MSDLLRQLWVLVGPGQRLKWFIIVVLALCVSAFEAIGTLLILGLLGVLVGSSAELHLPIIGNLVHLSRGPNGPDPIVVLAISVAVFFVLRGLLVIGQSYVQFRLAESAGARLSTQLLRGYLSMPYEFHLQRNSSEMIRNAFDGVQRFVGEALVPGINLLSTLAMVVGILLVLLLTSPFSTLLLGVVLGPLLWAILRLIQPRVKGLGSIAQRMAKENLQSLQQSLHGSREIVLLGREEFFVNKFGRDRRRLARARYLRRTASEIPRAAVETGVVFFIVAFLLVVRFTSGDSNQAVPVLGLFGYASVRLMPELNQIAASLNSLKFVGPAILDLHDDLRMFREIRRPTPDVRSQQFKSVLCLSGISYTYPAGETPALRDIDLTIHAGESIGIVGPSGGGKSTLVDIILGILEPTAGTVTVDGVDIRTQVRSWQSCLGVVSQMVFLMDDSIRRNVALGLSDQEIDDARVIEAIDSAQLAEFVASLPLGLDTYVGERGVRVSGGQRQRLAIARALYRRPDVLIFDEATAALDNRTEAKVMQSLQTLRPGKTFIIVAHRLTTIEGCDRIFFIKDGRVLDTGTYSDLIKRHAELMVAAS